MQQPPPPPDVWQTYVPEGKLFRQREPAPLANSQQWPADLTPNATHVHSLHDERWKSAQTATQRLVKRSTDNEQDLSTSQPLAAPAGAVVGAVPVNAPIAQSAIEPLEDAQRRDQDLELFVNQMERRPLRPSTQLVLEAPPATEILALCSQFKNSTMPWWRGAQMTLAAYPTMELPKTPVYPRAYLQPFFREPDPKANYERPCLNLNRNPFPGEEGRKRCIAHALSERRFGPQGAYRLREFLHSTTTVQINAALARQPLPGRRGEHIPDPRIHLPEVPEICIMCHVWQAFEDALNQKNRHEERKLMERLKEGGNAPAPDPEPDKADLVVIFNKFMVQFDKPGEYSRYALLAGDEVGLGIWGPFPLWQESNYVPWVDPSGTGLRGFQEVEKMLFRQAPAPSRAIESNPATLEVASGRLNRTSVTPARTTFPH